MATKKDANEPKASKTEQDKKEEQGFSQAFDPNHEAMNNKNIRALADSYTINNSKALSAFVGRSFDVFFNDLKFLNPLSILEGKTKYIYADFMIDHQSEHGLLVFEPVFLDKVINFLYGAGEHQEESVMQFGKCALKIVQKIAEIHLEALTKSIDEIQPSKFSLVSVNDSPKGIRKKDIPANACQLNFNLVGMQTNTELGLVLPESYIQQLCFEQGELFTGQAAAHSGQDNQAFKEGIIDSVVDLLALMPEIKMKLSEVMNLKKGDLIAIPNPEQVEIKLGQRKAYRAVVGQSNNRRVVKITERL